MIADEVWKAAAEHDTPRMVQVRSPLSPLSHSPTLPLSHSPTLLSTILSTFHSPTLLSIRITPSSIALLTALRYYVNYKALKQLVKALARATDGAAAADQDVGE